MFRLQQIRKAFQGRPALDGIDLEIAPGRTTVLIGPSGCGKSTLLRLLIGLAEPDAGSLRFDGQLLSDANIAALRLRMGYVIQQGGLFPHLTAGANVTLMAEQLGWDAERIRQRLAQLSDLTHFPRDGLDRYPSELSGGQNQRLALMRALMLDPEVLLLDEPLGALDPMIRYELQQDLKEIFAALHKTVVLVTHDLAEAAFLGHRIVLMRDGRILQRGTLADMMAEPAEPFVEQFIRAQRSHLGVED
ncbi:ATP-binding cassette domain-containing protein [Thiorhodococcus mannitoliphagus]|uniref:ATP-binding cassette domain-containing protein n=1 Tax=Thiorhodococcus mannitoliphagus TaxID=329406 RepID=A0A6P1E100_9GAMM|nr:ATP-binding cassette domain-containing protein [Thiorhodococcus mannitoliphagus]NEX23589.1 ATP-binding cassette domain-containing protein [Thiorhodococcus mannitoliphagus]